MLERDEGIRYQITAYIGEPKNAGDLAEGLFHVALDEGNTKIMWVKVKLFDTIISNNLRYCNSIEEIEDELRGREKFIAEKFSDDPEVKSVAQGRKIVFIQKINLLCELESPVANKITMRAIYEDFQPTKALLYSLGDRMIKRGLARRILGYKLGRSIDELKIGEVDIWGDEVLVYII